MRFGKMQIGVKGQSSCYYKVTVQNYLYLHLVLWIHHLTFSSWYFASIMLARCGYFTMSSRQASTSSFAHWAFLDRISELRSASAAFMAPLLISSAIMASSSSIGREWRWWRRRLGMMSWRRVLLCVRITARQSCTSTGTSDNKQCWWIVRQWWC